MVEVLLGGSARRPWRGDTAFERKGTDLLDDGGALTDEPFSDAMQRLEIALVAGLDGDEFHHRALHGLGNRFRVIEIVLLSPLHKDGHTSRASAERCGRGRLACERGSWSAVPQIMTQALRQDLQKL